MVRLKYAKPIGNHSQDQPFFVFLRKNGLLEKKQLCGSLDKFVFGGISSRYTERLLEAMMIYRKSGAQHIVFGALHDIRVGG